MRNNAALDFTLTRSTHAQAHHQEFLYTLPAVWDLVAPGCLKLHVLCSTIVAIYNANQDARRTVTPTTRRVRCNVPRVSPHLTLHFCTPGTRHGIDAVM